MSVSACRSVSESDDCILSQCFLVNSSKWRLTTSRMRLLSRESSRRSICSMRHSCRLRAPMPGGANSCSRASTLSTSAGVVSVPWYMASSSTMLSVDFRSSPSSSSEPIRYSMIVR